MSAPLEDRERLLELAKRYPYAGPRRSFVLAAGREWELVVGHRRTAAASDRIDLSAARVRDRGTGRDHPLADLPARDLDPAALRDRIPVLAYGANRTPEALERKRARPGFPAYSSIVVLRARLHDLDVVHSAHVSPYGSIGSTLARSEGTSVAVCVTLLTATQLAAVAQTEPNYRLEELHGVRLELDGGGRLERVRSWVSRHGSLVVGGSEVALSAIEARGRRLRELGQAEALAAAAARTGHRGGLDEFILESVRDPELPAARTRVLREDARPLDWPRTPAGAP